MKSRLVRVHLICATTLLTCGPVLAQLSPEDIAAMRERGRAEGWTFTIGENAATAYPLHELCGAVEPPDWQLTGPFDPSTPSRDLPARFDWRDYGGCTPVRNQAGCGSCWAFGAIGNLESTLLLNEHVSEDLSEQWLVSCTGAGSCSGGWHTEAYNFLRCNGSQDPCGDSGAVLEADFSYVAWNAPCGCPYSHPYCVDSWAYVGAPWSTPTVGQIKQAILNYGPISTCVYVNAAFQLYSGGVFNACESEWINHVVVLVGWDDNLGTNGVWIIRNSWSAGWGDQGYMFIEYGCSEIGYATAYVNYGTWPDCNSDAIPDYRDIAWGTSHDCNFNLSPDECDLAEGTSQDNNQNGIPDDCEIKRPMPEDCSTLGTGDKCSASGTCNSDADCWEESHCVLPPPGEPGSGVCYAPKTRYLSIARHPEQAADTARRIKLDNGTVLGWVGEPSYVTPVQEPSGFWLAEIVSTPHYETTWPDVLYVTGCQIAHASLCDGSGVHCNPNSCPAGETCVHHAYHVQAIQMGQDIGDEYYYSEALVLYTPSTWGDTVSTITGDDGRPPNGVIGVEDIMAAARKYQIVDVAPIMWVDIDPSIGDGVPEQSIGVGDIMKAIDGYQSKPYPGLGPLNCP